jgi:uncharacterized membrane protein
MNEENPPFPLAPAPFTGECREVDIGACFDWLRQGWAIFAGNPGAWIGSTVLLLVILLAISIVPVFGQIGANLLLPLFGAGLLQLCRVQSEGRQAEIVDIFIGFRKNAGPLVMVGVIYVAGVFGIAFIAFLLVSGGILGGVITGKVAGVGIAFGGVMLAAFLVMILSIPVIMATWFAPALVFFHHMKPVDAMKASFAAGIKNWLAMSFFGIMLMIMAFFAMLPIGLGLLLLIPVFSGAVYASYRDIFEGV